MKLCSIDGCARFDRGCGLCTKHYMQIKRHGKILERTIYDKNIFIKYETYYEMILYDSRGTEVGKALIDSDDYTKVSPFKWHLNDQGYVLSMVKDINNKRLRLHRFVLDALPLDKVDHIKRGMLARRDCRKSNLRLATHSQNMGNISLSKRNTSGYKGVIWHARAKKWMVQAMINRVPHYLGLYYDKHEAAKVYDAFVISRRGAFAAPNKDINQ